MIEIVVCDDDLNDQNHVLNILHEIFTTRNIAYNAKAFSSADELLDHIQKIDIGILDIAMEGMNGIELGRRLKEKFPHVKLIYSTSYEEYCLQAINDVHAFSFLCKPLEVHKVQAQITEALNSRFCAAAEKEFYNVTDSRKKEYASIMLKLEDILYFECIKRQRKAAVVLQNETYEYKCVFQKLAKELEPYDFIVNSRGILVNLRHIEKLKGTVIYLDNGEELPIAQKRVAEFQEKLNGFLQKNL